MLCSVEKNVKCSLCYSTLSIFIIKKGLFLVHGIMSGFNFTLANVIISKMFLMKAKLFWNPKSHCHYFCMCHYAPFYFFRTLNLT